MRILVIDREPLTAQLISSRLTAKGHDVVIEAQKQTALDMIRDSWFDCVLIDPAPLSDARPVVVGVWKNLKGDVKPSLLLLSKTANLEDAVKAGCNDFICKPIDARDLEIKAGNADRLLDLARTLTSGEEVHSQGGVIGKNAFNQLFLSAIDRAFRYAERSFVAFLSIDNMDQIIKDMGEEKALEAQEKLARELVFMRRQSDVIGRVGKLKYAILLQRPMYETEPLDACGRFAEFLEKYRTKCDEGLKPVFTLSLIELPMGALHLSRTVPGKKVDLSNLADEA